MAKTTERYEYVKATVDCGELSWKYKVVGMETTGSMRHDEDVSEWSDDDIREVTAMMLDVPDDDRDKIEVRWN